MTKAKNTFCCLPATNKKMHFVIKTLFWLLFCLYKGIKKSVDKNIGRVIYIKFTEDT